MRPTSWISGAVSQGMTLTTGFQLVPEVKKDLRYKSFSWKTRVITSVAKLSDYMKENKLGLRRKARRSYIQNLTGKYPLLKRVSS